MKFILSQAMGTSFFVEFNPWYIFHTSRQHAGAHNIKDTLYFMAHEVHVGLKEGP